MDGNTNLMVAQNGSNYTQVDKEDAVIVKGSKNLLGCRQHKLSLRVDIPMFALSPSRNPIMVVFTQVG